MDLPDKAIGCHRTGFAKTCRTLVVSGKCNRWIGISGSNPNTGEPVKPYDCIDNWMPMLLIENSQMQRQTGASADKVANEVRGLREDVFHLNTQPAAIVDRSGTRTLIAEKLP